jgi:MFS family permease
MLAVAVGWQVYALTRSPLDLGLVGLVQFLPALCFALVVGHVADRYDRRVVLRVAETVEALAAAALALGTIQGWLNRDGIFAIVAVSGTARAFEQPSMQAIVPSLVPGPLVARAIALAASASQAAVIVGPAIGGFIYALGAYIDYAVCAGLYILATLLLTLVRVVHVPSPRAPVTLQTLLAGISYIRAKKAIFGAMSLDLFAVLLGGATALLPIYARDILFVGPIGLGLLRSAPAVGALTVSILLSRRSIERHAGVIVLATVALFGVMTIVFALSTWFALSLAALVVLGASDSVSVVIRNSLVQLETPDAMRGRVSAVHSLFIGTSNTLGEFESGVTAAWFGTVPAVLLGGIGTLVVVALWIKLFPELVKFDRLRDNREPASAPKT